LSGCDWTARSNVGWITIASAASRSGAGSVTYDVDENTGSVSRTGSLTIAGRTFTVTQGAACTYTLSPSSLTVKGTGTTATVNVTAGAQCGWSVTESAAWLTVGSGSGRSGSGSFTLTVAANSGGSRQTTVAVAGASLVVKQTGGSPGAPTGLRLTAGD
jgi:hypothetical protein